MKEVVSFLRENPVQYFATVGLDGRPKVRPFQFMMEREGKLYFCTSNQKPVFSEMQKTPWVEVCVANGLRWLRLSGRAVCVDDLAVKDAVVESSALVRSIYGEGSNPIFEVFYLEEAHGVIADLGGKDPEEYDG